MIGSLCVGDAAVRSRNMPGRKHEYLLSQVKSGGGRRGGESPDSSLPARRSASRTGAARGCSPRGDGTTASSGGKAARISLARGTWPTTLRRGASERLCWPVDRFRQASLGSERSGRPDRGGVGRLQGCPARPAPVLVLDSGLPRTLAIGSKRRAEMWFIDARRLGRIVDRTHRGLADDVAAIADSRQAWRTASPMFPALAGAPRWTWCAITAMCRLRGAVSVRHPSRNRGNCPTRR